ncbi:MAG: DUF4340 domain-containing protein [Fibrobacteria bacterium]|nr:DUF4340 domain-containing protein [Fibrobacteria bacterium]
MIKKVITLVLAVVVLIGLIMYKKKAAVNANKSVHAIDKSIKSDVQSIKVGDNNDSVFVFFKDNSWLVGKEAFPADTAVVNKLLDVIFTLEDKDVVSRNPERYSEYGLDSAARKTVTLFNNTGEAIKTVYLGKMAAVDYNSTYWKKQDMDNVYRTPGNFSNDIKTKGFDWKDKVMYNFEKKDITTLEVSWKDSLSQANRFSVKAKGDGGWEMTTPKVGLADDNMVNTMANQFKQVTIDEFPSEIDSTQKAMPATIEIKVTLTDGKSYQLNAQKDAENYLVKHPSRDEIVKIKTYKLDVFLKTADDLYKPDTTAKAPIVAVPAPDSVK